jgi:hypothetical protein
MHTNGRIRLESAPDALNDRRAERRYPIRLELRYKLIRRRRILETGSGSTVNLSSGGTLFETAQPLPPGLDIEVSMAWPVLLNNVTPLRLVFYGRIVRSERNRTGVRALQHEFRIQGTQSLEEIMRPRTAGAPL